MARSGTCFCGSIEVEMTGEPVVMGYCHCRSCRSWSGGPVNALTLWKAEAVRVTKGEEHLATFDKGGFSQRQFCRLCGGHVMARHPSVGLIDVFAAMLPDMPFLPSVHVHYAQTVLPMKDGLPKYRDFPAGFGGSNETIAE
jgi:hypothetical protein